MASLSKDPKTGTRRIQFTGLDRKRKTVYLPGETLANARTIKTRVESLLKAAHSKYEWPDDLAKWVSEISDQMAKKLAKVGLIPTRANPENSNESTPVNPLGQFLESYISGRAIHKPNTRRNYRVTKQHLLNYFGRDKPLADITPGDADAWREGLLLKGMQQPTVSREVKRAKQFFRAATRLRLIAENPFEDVKGGRQENRSRFYFVSREEAQKVLDACPDSQWRLIFALCRFGGLRCPSEVLALTWDDVDWEHGRITVRSPKTEHHEGKESRVIPLFAELKPYFDEAWEVAEKGNPHIITRCRNSRTNLRSQFERIIKRAGLKPWPKLFVNLRSTRETELAKEHPIHVVCEWIGNSELVASRHYLQVTDEDFEKALEPTTHETTQSQQIPGNHESSKERHTADSSQKDGERRQLVIARNSPEGCTLCALT